MKDLTTMKRLMTSAAAAAALALSGCSATPSTATSTPTVQATGHLTVQVSTGLNVQAAAPSYALSLNIVQASSYGWSTWAKDFGPIVATSDATIDAGEVPVGRFDLTLTLKDATGKVVATAKNTGVQILSGKAVTSHFDVVVGGSAATDLELSSYPDVRSIWGLSAPDGRDNEFRYSSSPYTNYFLLTQGTATRSFFLTNIYDYNTGQYLLIRRWGDYAGAGSELVPGTLDTCLAGIADTAVYVDSLPVTELPAYTNVRHFAWTSGFLLGDQRKMLRIDRWFDSTVGLIKETVTDGETVLSTLTRTTSY